MNNTLVSVFFAASLAGCGFLDTDEFTGYAQVDVNPPVELGLIANGSFESCGATGFIDNYAETGRFGINGGGGVRVHVKGQNPLFWFLPDKDARFLPKGALPKNFRNGVKYTATVDVHPNPKTDIFVSFNSDVGNSKVDKRPHADMSTRQTKTDLGDGWYRIQQTFTVANDPQEFPHWLYLWLRTNAKADPNSPEAYVDFDNFTFREESPSWYCCNTWPICNQIYSDEGRIRFNSFFFGAYLEDGAVPAYGVELLKGDDGRLLARASASADEHGNFTADLGMFGYEGPVKARVTVYDRKCRLRYESRMIELAAVKKPVNPKGITVTENGVVLKDGRPFMPIGFYTGLCKITSEADLAFAEFHLKRLHEAGFDTIMDYSGYMLDGELGRKFLKLCERYKIWFIADEPSGVMYEKEPSRAIARTKYFAESPAVIGFYTMDEQPEEAIPRLERVRRMMNEVAPGRIVNICNIMRPAPYLPIADIQGGDGYPISKAPTSSLASCHKYVTNMMNCAPAAIWWAPQAYNWARMVKGYKDPEVYRMSGREPTEHEMLSVALCNAADGVTGFLFYSYFDIIECPVKEWREGRFAAMTNICRYLKEIEPFIMSGEKRVPVPAVDTKDPVRATALSDGAGKRIVIVCGLGKDHESEVIVPPEFGDLKPRFGNMKKKNGKWMFKGKDFTCDVLE
ncbi:MAG TPA: hypothetical protein PKI32_00145 [Opitutales bacterium]|nr:hypothetical protein [Opitutales bacterium]